MENFSKMLELVKENGGEYRGGNSWDTIHFECKDHKEVSKKVFNECKELGLSVYHLVNIDEYSYFYYK